MREWSAAVWSEAEALGPTPLDAGEVERGLALAQRPVFVCGAARSGTTLLRDLLDGHPRLAVVPTESLFYTYLEKALFSLRPARHSEYLGRRWLERLVAPPPYWLLGGTAAGHSPYVTFARDFAAWWRVPERRRAARIPSWPIAALALAYARHLGGGTLPAGVTMWAEKTPTSERFLERIWREFPDARVVHIVRRPDAVLASLKAMVPGRWSHLAAVDHCIRHLAPTYRIAAASPARCEQHCLIRYEELTANPETTMAQVAAFLGIEPLPLLLLPTVTGRPATNNTSFGKARPRSDDALDKIEQLLLALTVSRPAARLGYTSDHTERYSVVG